MFVDRFGKTERALTQSITKYIHHRGKTFANGYIVAVVGTAL